MTDAKTAINRTDIFKTTAYGEERVGYVDGDTATGGTIYKMRWQEGQAVGRYDAAGRIYRNTQHDERELGSFTADGTVRSHGLFEGGELGWVDPDGVVVQGGLILGEEEVGRVDGPNEAGAAAALLLLFLPDDAEANRKMQR